MTFDEWRATRRRTTTTCDVTEREIPCYEYGPGRNVINIESGGQCAPPGSPDEAYTLEWMGEYHESSDLHHLETILFERATREGLL
jgi:hypothetical protein